MPVIREIWTLFAYSTWESKAEAQGRGGRGRKNDGRRGMGERGIVIREGKVGGRYSVFTIHHYFSSFFVFCVSLFLVMLSSFYLCSR